jgi:uncharacterized membrane protein YkoI
MLGMIRKVSRAGAFAGLAFGLALPAALAQEVLPPDKVKEDIASAYNVEVLKVVRDDNSGKPVYRVVVMNPPGDTNEAFMVTTLVVDAATGTLIPQFQHLREGYALPPGHDKNFESDPAYMRWQSLRPH